jgi:predicted DCC family thiol-disulfide oxidoreductase YuxK
MPEQPHLRVSNPPPKPLMIWDGDCHFCRRWIERWEVLTAGAVDYAPYQEAAQKFPEIPRDQYERSVVFVDADGCVYFAAEAVYRSLRYRRSWRWLSWSYDHVSGFAAFSELFYRIIARHRGSSSIATRWLWGDDVRPPTYFRTRRRFLRALGFIYLIAFVSFWVQVDGLIGTNGIVPVGQFLSAAHQQLGAGAFSALPTLCWLNSSDGFLHFLCGAGVIFSLLLIFEIAPAISLGGLFAFYLSLTIAGQTFLSFQWDILLLETGFLAIFLAPWQFWPGTGPAPVSRVPLFLLKLLLFKLMLMSGVVKLTSGDPTWGWTDGCWHWNAATALDYHYWSQPLPTIIAWYADKQSDWFKHFSVAFCLVVEIIVPFFIWAPRRLRVIAFSLLVFLQLAIAITGNYGFFNLLTIALCLLLIDDAVWRRKRGARQDVGATRRAVEGRVPGSPASQEFRPPFRSLWTRCQATLAVIVLLITLPLNAWLIFTAFKPDAEWPRPLALLYERVEAFRMTNGYGLFRVMTKDRREIIVEGSADGIDWLPYEFKWKPGDMKRAPGWCAPHQPRVDWQMWFAALGAPQQNPWFVRLVICLLEGKKEVSQLLERNPFPAAPPRYVRASFYRYRFTTASEHRETGAWWKREELGEYLRPVSLR